MREVGIGVGRLDMVGLVLKASRWAVDRVRLVDRGLRILLAHRPHDGAGSLNITPQALACLRESVKDTEQMIDGDRNVVLRIGLYHCLQSTAHQASGRCKNE